MTPEKDIKRIVSVIEANNIYGSSRIVSQRECIPTRGLSCLPFEVKDDKGKYWVLSELNRAAQTAIYTCQG